VRLLPQAEYRAVDGSKHSFVIGLPISVDDIRRAMARLASAACVAQVGDAGFEPAWWLNLQAQPDATVQRKDGSRAVRARMAQGDERARLWARWRELGDDVDGYATRRPKETAVVVLERRP